MTCDGSRSYTCKFRLDLFQGEFQTGFPFLDRHRVIVLDPLVHDRDRLWGGKEGWWWWLKHCRSNRHGNGLHDRLGLCHALCHGHDHGQP